MYPAPQPGSGWQSLVRRASAPGVDAPAPPTARKTARHARAPTMTSFLTDLSPSLESAEVGLCQRNRGFAGAPERPCKVSLRRRIGVRAAEDVRVPEGR